MIKVFGMYRIRVAALISAFTFSFCITPVEASGGVDLVAYQTQAVSWGKCPSSYFRPEDEQSKDFKKDSVVCGKLNVPARYSMESALPDFKIAMMREPATDSDKLGTLFINPGGPGESGVEELQFLDFPAEIRAKYDIIGFDPRGVNHSAPATGHQIQCNNRSYFETFWRTEPTPTNDKEYLKNLDIWDAYYLRCAKDNPSWWTLTTSNVVDDLDLMRSVLTGSAPLNFLGSSYGTTIASAYITRFPEHVGHVALDSPTSNEPTSDASQIADATSREANLMRLIKGYAKAKKISVTAVKKLILQARRDADNNKLTGFAGMKVLNSSKQIHQSSEYMFTYGMFAMTYYDVETIQEYFNEALDAVSGPKKRNAIFEYFALELNQFDTDSLAGSKYQPNKIKRTNAFEIMEIVDYLDVDYFVNTTYAHDAKLARQLQHVSPFWTKLYSGETDYGYQGRREAISWSSLAKADPKIPDPPKRAPKRTNTSGKPVLVVGARYESTTPYVFAVKTARDLKSPLVTFNGTGHSPLAYFDKPCLNAIFIAYFINNTLPAKSVTCTK